ncbi:hypothetical protein G9P44_000850 [Scheffersomyces stipitis]|nr:hypothetical protein G9P44_000850 [Scheffersomyces stipitis]
MAERRLFKELNQYRKNPPSSNNHQIVSLNPVDEDDIFKWEAVISKPSKKDSQFYYQGEWKLGISVPSTYPITPPQMKFVSPICHPNINITTGEICLDILKSDSWSPAWNLENLLVAILMLLDNPEPDSPLNLDSANLFRHDKLAFESLVQYTLWKYNTFYEASTSKDTTGLKPITSEDTSTPISGSYVNVEDEVEESESEKEDNETIKEPVVQGDLQPVPESTELKDVAQQNREVTLDKAPILVEEPEKVVAVPEVKEKTNQAASATVSIADETLSVADTTTSTIETDSSYDSQADYSTSESTVLPQHFPTHGSISSKKSSSSLKRSKLMSSLNETVEKVKLKSLKKKKKPAK